MNKQELSRATEIAKDVNIDLSNVDHTALFGCALPGFKPVYVTIETAAKMIREQCAYFNGGWDSEEFSSIADILKRKAMVL